MKTGFDDIEVSLETTIEPTEPGLVG